MNDECSGGGRSIWRSLVKKRERECVCVCVATAFE